MEMVERTITVGDVEVTVRRPKDVPEVDLTVRLRPQTPEEFLRCAEATGGLDTLTLPTHDSSHPQAAHHFGQGYFLVIEEPPREAVKATRPHPFFGALAEQVKREKEAAADGPR